MSSEWRCPLNRGVPEEKFHCIYLSIMWKKRMVSPRCSGQETKILNQKYIMQYIIICMTKSSLQRMISFAPSKEPWWKSEPAVFHEISFQRTYWSYYKKHWGFEKIMAYTPTKLLGAILGAISSKKLSDDFASRVDALSDLSLRPALHSSNASMARLHGVFTSAANRLPRREPSTNCHC